LLATLAGEDATISVAVLVGVAWVVVVVRAAFVRCPGCGHFFNYRRLRTSNPYFGSWNPWRSRCGNCGIGLDGTPPPESESGDQYVAVSWAEHTLTEYGCGVRAGDRLRLKRDLDLLDHDGQPTRGVIAAGSIWCVLPGLPREPDVVWLEEPSGKEHTWDATVLDDFDLVDGPS
jgi:hypothetical protein